MAAIDTRKKYKRLEERGQQPVIIACVCVCCFKNNYVKKSTVFFVCL